MQTEPAPVTVRYFPPDAPAAARLGVPPYLDVPVTAPCLPEQGHGEDSPTPAPRLEPDRQQGRAGVPRVRNFHAVSGIVRAIDDGPYFDSPTWTRVVRSEDAAHLHVGARLEVYPWIKGLASTADHALSGKAGKASNIGGGIALYRIAHPEHPEELWADLYRRLFRGVLKPRDPAEAFRAEFFRQAEKGAAPQLDERATTKLQVGSTIRLMREMTAARPKAHPIGRPFYSLDEPFPIP